MNWDDVPDWAQAVAQSLMRALKERDPYTFGHCSRVARNARFLARAAGLNEHEQRVIEYASLFHDLGKLGIPDSVLLKPGRLTPEERLIIQEHPIKSAEILQPLEQIPFFRSTLPGVRNHHERHDGLGYPDRIQGEDIPLSARLILIVDTFDAMTTTRPYRKGLPFDVAYKELRQFAGRQFDRHLVEAFIRSHPHWGEFEKEITEEFIITHSKKRVA